MVLDDLPDVLLHVLGDGTLGDLGEQSLLRASKVLAELAFPANDLVNGDGVEL